MKNSIAERVGDFLKNYPPFNMVRAKNLTDLASEINIIYLEKGNTVFKKGDSTHEHFYIVRDGAISSNYNNGKTIEIMNIHDTGDIFGLKPLISKDTYNLTTIANEESIVYAIPIALFQSITDNNAKIQKYLITAFASNTYTPYTAEESGKIFVDYLPNTSQDIVNFQTVNYTKAPITCSLKSTLKSAAKKMCKHKIGCIIVVDENKKPAGIITNSDIKNKIATGLFPIDTRVTNIMNSPVITGKKDLTVADGQLQMIKNNIGHLCITKDGSINSKLIGVLSHHDVLATLGNNPSVILKEIKRAKRTKKLRATRRKANGLLKSYLEQNIPISHIINVISQINDAVTIRAIELAIKKMPTPPPVTFSWLALGSQGRKEQLLFTDQDNALVFEDVPEKKREETQTYFLELSNLITQTLNKIGFEYCEADMMASNPEWCKSLSEWQNQFKKWILKPDEKAILLSSIFFDYNCVYGNQELINKLTDTVYNTLQETTLFFRFLASDAIKSPSPLGFFRQFLIEQNGEQKELFNIKSRAVMPLVDAARLLILSKQIRGVNNTYERFERLAQLEPENKELYESCSYAFKALSKFKTKQGLLHNNSGKLIDLETLTKEEKLKLRRCFKPIQEIQEILKIRFDLKNFI
ncbi:MAG: DUF294 nucleotidyltransferase-like domain-containing protein [Algibacter sp.]|uniref:DUF294 nucleotidyltransferase-like domain-containing protein n=1 Tax=Algibacter sp. TaxID=1872428 RepID=UPI002624F102|nr:DUF294 nucleotidyltransferase-like domain-containing protein [Algibacter sp.]MDG1729724.1 DUF294 nucleotidyltransferase-like domain-containing protein [Algibacter sp.]MDG2177878.1 DUF294 nucleotidyltransferase-like domain-containing protein [Algibacter sp.]